MSKKTDSGFIDTDVRGQCKCIYWARTDGFLTTHHPNCEHYQKGLIDVWKVTVDGKSCYVEKEQDAIDTKGDDHKAVITKERMHREIFDRLPNREDAQNEQRR